MRGGYPSTVAERTEALEAIMDGMRRAKEKGNYGLVGKLVNILISMDRYNLEAEKQASPLDFVDAQSNPVVIVMPSNGREHLTNGDSST